VEDFNLDLIKFNVIIDVIITFARINTNSMKSRLKSS